MKSLMNKKILLILLPCIATVIFIVVAIVFGSNKPSASSNEPSSSFVQPDNVVTSELTVSSKKPISPESSTIATSSQIATSQQPESSKEASSETTCSSAVSSQSNVSSQQPITVIEESTEGANPNPQKTYEENVKKREARVKEYLEKHNIDPKTAGETGEKCPNCGKKIWNPNKYGLANPGYPDDYENSGYCTGWCAVQVG